MKSLVAVLAVLFLVSTFALAEQQYQPLPFPQAANTALNGGEGSPSLTSDVPVSMAANQKSTSAQMANSGINSGSPFPSAGNPSLGADTSEQSTPAAEHQHNLGSPFPSDASPSNR